MSNLHAHLIVFGRVQGVGFRFTTKQVAKELGVNGWVRNLLDSSVEIEAEGNAKKVEQFIDAIKANPSPVAKVTDVDLTISKELEGYRTFKTARP